jgi:hypothetical protein
MLLGLQKLQRSPFVREGAQLLSYQQPQSKMLCLFAYQIPPEPCSFREFGKAGLQKGQTLPWAFKTKKLFPEIQNYQPWKNWLRFSGSWLSNCFLYPGGFWGKVHLSR